MILFKQCGCERLRRGESGLRRTVRVANRSIDLLTKPDSDAILKPNKINGKRDYILIMTSRRTVSMQRVRTRQLWKAREL